MSADDSDSSNSCETRNRETDSDIDSESNTSKRQRTTNDIFDDKCWRNSAPEVADPKRRQLEDYTVGWICALPIELAASHAMLDSVHKNLPTSVSDTNAYILGNIGTHNVVMACLPSGQYGTNNAATVASNMTRSFPSIHIRLMVGIGGGIPGNSGIKLGDVVVGDKVIQHDLGKVTASNGFEGSAIPTRPPHNLLKAVSKLRAYHERQRSLIPTYLQQMHERYPRLKTYQYPRLCQGCLSLASNQLEQLQDCSSCAVTASSNKLSGGTPDPKIHYGGIASGNQVIKCKRTRDKLAEKLGVICVEMEAAGLADSFPCIVIRGLCDWADSYKNKQWQKYAAATAAAYAKEFVSIITPSNYNITPLTNPPGISTEDLQKKFHSRRQPLMRLLRFEHMDNRRATIGTAHLKTCQWLLQDASYLDWLDLMKMPQHHGFFWISGKPGAGKSTIMKFMLDRALKNSDTNNAILSFFFHARGHILEKSTPGLYRSLLFQLLEYFPTLQSVLDDLTIIPLNRGHFPTGHVVQELFREAVMALGRRRLTCFIDALDECDESEIRQMIVYFEGLAEEAIKNDIQLKVCLSSRHYPHINVRHGLRVTLEDRPGHGQDLERYVKDHLRAGDGAYFNRVRSEIFRKAGGVFMWVVLVVEILNKEILRGRGFRIEQQLQQIPAELGELFRDILLRDGDNMEEFLLCCQWVLFAARPLHPREFYFAMLAGMAEIPQESLVYDPEVVTDKNIDLYVNSSSKGLAEVTKSANPTVQFIHESVRDFLIRNHGLQQFALGPKENLQALSHDRLKENCSSYIKGDIMRSLLPILLADTFEDWLEDWLKDVDAVQSPALKNFPFLGYAIEYVLYHANMAGEVLRQDNFIDQFSVETWAHLANIIGHATYTQDVSLLYIAADKGLSRILETIIRHCPNTHPKGEKYGYPIFAALANRHLTAARTFLGHAATDFSDKQLFPALNYSELFSGLKGSNSFPLHWAIENHHSTLAMLMIRSGQCDCTALDFYGRSPMHWAAMVGDETILTALVEMSASAHQHSTDPEALLMPSTKLPDGNASSCCDDNRIGYIDAQDLLGSTPLLFAIENLQEAVIMRLLEWGADPDRALRARVPVISSTAELTVSNAKLLIERRLVSQWDVLIIAADRGLQPVIETVVDREGFFCDANDKGAQALEAAAMKDHVEAVGFLLQKGAGVSSHRQWDASCIMRYEIVQKGLDAIKYLVRNGAGLDYHDGTADGNKPLHLASRYGYESVAHFLIENGANVSARNRSGNTPLHIAAHLGHLSMLSLLIEHGSNVSDRNVRGETALHSACTNSYFHEAAARVLLECGAEANDIDQEGETCLHHAATCGSEVIVKLLLEYGGNVFVPNLRGETPLHRAQLIGHQKIVRILEEAAGGSEFACREHRIVSYETEGRSSRAVSAMNLKSRRIL